MCLEALSIQAFSGGHLKLEISLDVSPENGDACLSNAKVSATTPIPTMIALQESDMPFVKFPAVSKMQLRNKVREMSDFVDNHRQVSGFLKLYRSHVTDEDLPVQVCVIIHVFSELNRVLFNEQRREDDERHVSYSS
ncbi:hypothetical protein OIU78_005316 [Salix suchowensis]|nr:hypothetical protein OIU78_005316 [Salix suchowensis]